MTGGADPTFDAAPVPVACLLKGPESAALYRALTALPEHPLLRVLPVRADDRLPAHPTVGPYVLLALGVDAADAVRRLRRQQARFPIFRLFLVGRPRDVAEVVGVTTTVLVGAGDRDGNDLAAVGAPRVVVADRVDDPRDVSPAWLLATLVDELSLWAAVPEPVRAASAPVWRSSPAVGPDGSEPMGDGVSEVCAALARIPDSARRYRVTFERGWSDYRLPRGVLEQALESGLPHLPYGDGALFDPADLATLAWCPEVNTPLRVVLRSWARALRQPPDRSTGYEVSWQAGCPVPGHAGPCRFRLYLPEERVVAVTAQPGGPEPVVMSTFRPEGHWPDLPPRVVELLAELSDIRMVRMPAGMRWDVDFIRRNRIGDCAGLCRLVLEEGLRRGLPVRAAYGLIVVNPYSTTHYWPEVSVDGRWVPCDPGLSRSMVRSGVLDEWSLARPLGTLLHRLRVGRGPAVLHGAFSAPASFPTRPVRLDAR